MIKAKNVTIPNTVKYIGADAFYGYTKSITIPASVKSIDARFVNSCDKLKTIKVDSKNKYYSSYNDCLYNKTKTKFICIAPAKTTIKLSDKVKTIDEGAFYKAQISKITIPKSVTTIERYAFAYCTYLTKIIIPKNVTKIYSGAFVTFNGKLYFEGNAPSIKKEKKDNWQMNFSYNTGIFYCGEATVYYPTNNNTWTSAIKKNYGGKIT